MKKCCTIYALVVILLITINSCNNYNPAKNINKSVRPLKDTVGFAQYSWQMDSLMNRIGRSGWKKSETRPWNLVICPHDDYTYVGSFYPELLQNIKSPNLILIGVAHKAAQMGVEDSLVFDTYSEWKGPWKNIQVSPVREEIYKLLAGKFATINDSLQKVEHSVEALIPYLQYFNRDISIIPILVPAMSPDRMEECGKALADAIRIVAKNHNWVWGTDYSIVVTTDAVHYGNEDWGGVNRAYYGCDEKGNQKARSHEAGIIDSCFRGKITPEKIRLFNSKTLNHDNFREYKWTWCGRYSVPVALYASYYLDDNKELSGKLVGYSTSITSAHIPVDDLRMGRTAIATACHWVGYASIGYSAGNEKNMGLVTLSVINLRKNPEHSSELVSQAILGTPFRVLKKNDSWLQIQTPDNYTGWTQESSVKLLEQRDLEEWRKSTRIIYLDNLGWIYDSASEGAGIVGDVVGGSIMKKTGEANGYVAVELPDGRKGFLEKKKIMDFIAWENGTPATGESLCKLAATYTGIPYLWGGTSAKGADCSGYVQSVFFRNGIILARDASLQALHGVPVDISDGFSRLKKGDLLFFGSRENEKPHVTHVAMYLGNNEYINSAGRVMKNSLDPSQTDYNSTRINTLLLAKRVLGVSNDSGIVPVVKHPWY